MKSISRLLIWVIGFGLFAAGIMYNWDRVGLFGFGLVATASGPMLRERFKLQRQ